MRPSEAAAIIGCSPQHVRYLIRTGKMKAREKIDQYGQKTYSITKAEAERIRDADSPLGRPRSWVPK